MKVLALFQIYLPYLLPRDPSWSAPPFFQFHFDVEGHFVALHPRKQDEPLFPTPIDLLLRDYKLNIEEHLESTGCTIPQDTPTELIMTERCFDRIEAQVYGTVASLDECVHEDVIFTFRRSALSGCNRFLHLCRVAAEDPEISGIKWSHDFEGGRCHLPVAHTLTWVNPETMEPLFDDQRRLMNAASLGAIRLPVRRPVAFELVKQAFDQNDDDLPTEMLISAQERLITDQLQEGIVNLATACEIAATRYIERNGKSSDPQVREILKSKDNLTGAPLSFAEKYYHLLTMHIDRRSFKTEAPDAFALLENTYRTRNSLAHAGRLEYRSGGSLVTVTRSLANEFLRGCKRSVEWIARL